MLMLMLTTSIELELGLAVVSFAKFSRVLQSQEFTFKTDLFWLLKSNFETKI